MNRVFGNIFIAALLLIFIELLMFLFPLSFAAEENTIKNLKSESVILIDAATGEILFEKQSQKKMYPASITKILTAIIAIERSNLNDTVTVGKGTGS
ncbi:D-alanyl-D-alanine carboxypeptidase [Fictibacillus sp. S7]|uniref:D-alanyl-D-alanine carboxypeptidase n=1 Tax=Fictibacillus sp. S7 TaxID=2212476 RepID=UPI00241168FD|nr:D-alanyl-D-alanine carboxypeptidase [Fictibacillus sp. S7]